MNFVVSIDDLEKQQRLFDAVSIINTKSSLVNKKYLADKYECKISSSTLTLYNSSDLINLNDTEGLNINRVMIEYLFRYNAEKAREYAQKYNADNTIRNSNSDLSLITRFPANALAGMEFDKEKRSLKRVFYSLIKVQPRESLYYQFKFLYNCVFDSYFIYDEVVKKYGKEK